MAGRTALILVRLAPLVLVSLAAAAWFREVQGGGPYVLRNVLPMLLMLVLASITLWRGGGSWTGSGWSWPLGTAGFSIPALGLAVYLHYAYAVNLGGLFTGSRHPDEVFRYLPLYTVVSGGIGFAIGWIAGRHR
jgi:hypothetical protein